MRPLTVIGTAVLVIGLIVGFTPISYRRSQDFVEINFPNFAGILIALVGLSLIIISWASDTERQREEKG